MLHWEVKLLDVPIRLACRPEVVLLVLVERVVHLFLVGAVHALHLRRQVARRARVGLGHEAAPGGVVDLQSQAEVDDLDGHRLNVAHHHIIWFQVSVDDSALLKKLQCSSNALGCHFHICQGYFGLLDGVLEVHGPAILELGIDWIVAFCLGNEPISNFNHGLFLLGDLHRKAVALHDVLAILALAAVQLLEEPTLLNHVRNDDAALLARLAHAFLHGLGGHVLVLASSAGLLGIQELHHKLIGTF
mmetsp:Transcript_8503/g.24974  ORF Transcript_8503/g.24974 Transcript_8503/m.24974 type:complete len:246 (-) Transcript_8503:148-885(-)